MVEVLSQLPESRHPDLLSGTSGFADAGVFRLRDDLALVQTVDFFPPLVDDPFDFGRIAAANSLSDCYAVGGRPITALNVVAFPRKLPRSALAQILAGGAETVTAAGAVIVGGHTVEDAEIKYGLAVTGTVSPERRASNAGARPGDALVLTKPLGTGCIATGIKRRKADPAVVQEAITSMTTLNRDASELMIELGAVGATDITGFGLLGHACELAEASAVTLRLNMDSLPVLEGAVDLARRRLVSGGAARNRAFVASRLTWEARPSAALDELLHDSETSGGLLVSLPPHAARTLIDRLHERGHDAATIIGEVVDAGPRPLVLTAG